MNERFDLVVVGAGIVGLAHAAIAAESGARVCVLERDERALGASVRNFGMVWPVGQPAGTQRARALRSRARWLEFGRAAGIRVEECGSLHLAHHDDELATLEEFVAREEDGGFRLLSPEQVAARTDAARREGLRGALWSPWECGVDPRAAIPGLANWLAEARCVELRFQTPVRSISCGHVETTTGESLVAERVVIACGHELRTLYPDQLAATGILPCKLHMAKTVAQPPSYRFGPHIASGLTLRHYGSFEGCSSLAKVRTRVSEKSPELDRYGIHVMASRTAEGELVLGDSHEYGKELSPFDDTQIDDLILRELRKILNLAEWRIAQRWHGIYAKHPKRDFVVLSPEPGVRIVTGLGGAGMTLSFGVAEDVWNDWGTIPSSE